MPALMRTLRTLPPILFALSAGLAGLGCEDDPSVVNVTPKLELDPTSLDFGNVQVGTTVTKTFFIKNTGDGNLTLPANPLSQQEPSDAAFTFQVEGDRRVIVPNGNLTVSVTFKPDELRASTSVLEVRSSDTGVAPVTITLTGTGVTTTLAVDPEVLTFGNVVINTTKTLIVSLTNNSDVDANVELVTGQNVKLCSSGGVDPSTYCVNLQGTILGPDGRFALRAGQAAQMEVRFTPVIAGTTERGDLSLRACDSSACEREIRVSGVGIEQGFRCDPTSLDFGQVNPGSCLTRTVACENIANETVTVIGTAPANTGGNPTSADFQIESVPAAPLATGESLEVDVTYCPTSLGEDTGTLAIETDNRDARLRFVYVPLEGTGGGPDIEVFPAQLNFGLVSLIAPARRTVLITNAGQDALNISDIQLSNTTAGFSAPGAGGGVVQPGGSMEVTVEFLPTAEAPTEAELVILSDDQDEGEVRVRLLGEGINLPPCSFEVAPAQLSFGVVERGRVVSRAFEIRNVGSNVCLVTAVRLQPGSDPAFTLPDGDVTSLMVPAGAATTVRLDFQPTNTNTSNGGVEFSISSPTSPFNTVTLSGTGADATLLIVPNELDFGTIGVPCSARARTVTIYNTGSSAATIDSIALASPANPAFTIAGLPNPLPASPLSLAPGASTSFDVTFRAEQVSSYAGAVEINGTFAGNPVTYIVSLLGVGSNDARQVDNFEQLGKPKVDILFVIDNSGSMGDEQTALSANFSAFIQFAEAQAIEYQLAVTTTDVDSGGELGRFVPVTGSPTDRIVTPQTQPSPEAVFVDNVNVGINGSATEKGLEAAYLALSNPLIFGHNAGFLRNDAVLSVIFVSDEQDYSSQTVPFYINFLLSIKGFRNTNLFTASAIVGDSPGGCNGAGGSADDGARYVEVANRTGGVFQSICTSDWSRSLEDLSTTAFGFKSRFFLDNQPVISTIVVELDGVPIPATSPEGTVNWSYDYATNSVNFSPFATPEPGAEIQVEYVAECL